MNLKLGEVFWESVTHTNFPSGTSKFPYIRSAFVATNLVAPPSKVVDGVSRLIVKTDIQSLARKDNLTKCKQQRHCFQRRGIG